MAESMLIPWLDPFWVAIALFFGTYLLVMLEWVNRAVVALLGAGILILCGVLTQQQGVDAVDFNTLGLLAGMMVIVHITSKTGVFEYLAIWSSKKVNAHPAGMLLMLSLITAFCSALLDNVTTVLLITPVILKVTEKLEIKPYPFLFSAIFASNIGGTATLIGDPPNIMIGSALGLTFNDFLANLAPIIVVIFAATMLPIYLIWRKDLVASSELRAQVMAMRENTAIKDVRLLKHCLLVCGIVVVAFILAHHLHLEPATIAMTGAALLLLLENLAHPRDSHHRNVHSAFAEAEWVTLFFFVGLFILVAGIEKVGLIRMMAEEVLSHTGGDLKVTAIYILWGSAVLSALVDNIPFVATMIPLIQSMMPSLGGEQAVMPLWWALALGACLGGNGTLIGASANLVVAGMAERAGEPIPFIKYLKIAFPLMLISIVISHVYIVMRYFS